MALSVIIFVRGGVVQTRTVEHIEGGVGAPVPEQEDMTPELLLGAAAEAADS